MRRLARGLGRGRGRGRGSDRRSGPGVPTLPRRGDGDAYFKDWKMSVIDYAMFQSAYARKIRTDKGYYEYLSRNYASDVEYVNKLKKIVAKI